MIPQIIIIALWIIQISVYASKDGQPLSDKQQKYNVGSVLIRTIINFLILYSGGFFDVFTK